MLTYLQIAPERVLSGAGSAQVLPDQVRTLGARACLLTTRSLHDRTPAVRALEALLGGLHASTYPDCRQHSPAQTVEAAAARARETGADVLVAFGGGSVIDTSKAVALALAGDGAPPPQIALPTTLSAAEFTPAAGITDEATRVKGLRLHPRIVPRVVIHDPELTRHTPPELWLATGVKALDHALEALWARRPHPLADTLALEAVRRLTRWLPASRDAADLTARGECQLAAWMSIAGMISVRPRLSHPLGHQIGARWGVPHGVTSCVVLPAVMRHLAPATLDAQVRIAAALGVDPHRRPAEAVAAAAADRLAAFIASLGLPTRLRDTAAVHTELPAVAHAVAEELRDLGELGAAPTLLALLETMW